ncbi:MAG TPA: hypothetical protein VMU01_11420 [Rhizomicrobium sp.]|nr:hypothetical protein [Rhizomicrobium sp.]
MRSLRRQMLIGALIAAALTIGAGVNSGAGQGPITAAMRAQPLDAYVAGAVEFCAGKALALVLDVVGELAAHANTF